MLFQLNMQYKERIQKIAFILLFAWPIFFIPFGVDGGDSCYYLANYRHFFSGSVHHAIGTVLSSLLGSILYHINPFPMFITFRVLDYLINCVVWYCIYHMLKDSVSDLWLIPGIFVGAVLIRKYPMMLSYNSFSVLFFVLALFAMRQGLLKKQVKKIMLSGFLVGLNVMVRIPNALQGIMIILPLLYAAVDRAFTSKTAWRYSLYFLLASVSGLLLGVGITVVFSGWTLFAEGVKKLFLFGQGGSYSLQAVWNNINSEIIEIYEYLSPLKKYLFIAFMLPFIYTVCRIFIRQNWMLHCVRIAIAGITLWLAYRLGIGFNPQKYVYFLGSVSFVLSVLTILASAKLNKKLFLQAAMVLIVLVIWPLGTNNGMAHYSLIGAFLSGALIAYFNVFQGRTWNNSLQTSFVSSASTIGAALLLLIFFTGIVHTNILTYSYGDGNMDRLQSKVEVPELYGMRTSERAANALEAYYERIRQEDLKDRELAVAGRFPMAHALSNQKVFFKETWSDLSILDKEKQLEMLYNAETLPIIVLGAVSENSFASQVQAFAESHNYRRTEHSLFTFYIPNE